MEKSIDIYHNVMRVPKCLRHVKGFDYLGEPWFWARNRVWYQTEKLTGCGLLQYTVAEITEGRVKTAWKIT